MTKQDFAIKLLVWLMPWPLSKLLPRILVRILAGPSARTPMDWAQATYDAISQYLRDATAYAQALLDSIADVTPTDQLTAAAAALTAAIENATSALAALTQIMDNLEAYTPDQISQAFSDTIAATDHLTSATDDLVDVIQQIQPPAVPVIPYKPPPELPAPINPFNPPSLFPGFGTGTRPTVLSVSLLTWFYDDFDTIDPAVWTDYSSGSGLCSIVDNKLKMLSSSAGDYAYLTTGIDPTIPSSFTWTFQLNFESGNGYMRFEITNGSHMLEVQFSPPNYLYFRQKAGLGFKAIDVGNYMGLTHTWKFVYDGTLCDIYRDDTLIDSGLTTFIFTGDKGERFMHAADIITVFIDDYTITSL